MNLAESIYNYSIIIPHKNIPALLQRCLDSIPKRDDIQVIIVDDTSDSEIVDFENFPGLNNLNTEVVFTKEGKGAGYARNIGISKANGKWLSFIDADDFFNPSISDAFEKYKDSVADIVCFGMTSVNSDDITQQSTRDNYVKRKFDEARLSHSMDIIRFNHGIVPGRFIKLDLIKQCGAKYQETMYRNDTLFAVQIGCNAQRIILDDMPIYCYTYRNNSTIEIINQEAIRVRFFVSKSVMKYLRKQGKGYTLFEQDLLNSWDGYRANCPGNKFIDFLEVLYLAVDKKRVIKKWYNRN
jgi:glycosyltransferase involved in cell wall biosynthesis